MHIRGVQPREHLPTGDLEAEREHQVHQRVQEREKRTEEPVLFTTDADSKGV